MHPSDIIQCEIAEALHGFYKASLGKYRRSDIYDLWLSGEIDIPSIAEYRSMFIEETVCDLYEWEPTEQDFKDLCGVWACEDFPTLKVTPDSLKAYYSRCNFEVSDLYLHYKRIEPMPEQCLPKKEKEVEHYAKHWEFL